MTLVGTGGVGKTRIAVRVGEKSMDEGLRGVWVVELAPTRDAAMVIAATARTLGVSSSLRRSLLESTIGALRRDRVLIVLDNCEHVLADARDLVTAILRACPNVRILATSREPLNASGRKNLPGAVAGVSVRNGDGAPDCAISGGEIVLGARKGARPSFSAFR